MNTIFLLMAEFEQADIPLDKVATKYLDLEPAKAKRLAARQELPFPVFRAGSQKSPWMVNINELACYLDKKREEAKKDWQAINAA